jgi:hypothetical protein
VPQPIRADSINLNQLTRDAIYTTVDASPSAAAETVIATLVIPSFADIAVISGIRLSGWAALTIGTSGASLRLRIRQTSVGGTVKADTGVLTGGIAAGNLVAQDVEGFDSGAGVGTYVLTATIGSGAATSTVSALVLEARII